MGRLRLCIRLNEFAFGQCRRVSPHSVIFVKMSPIAPDLELLVARQAPAVQYSASHHTRHRLNARGWWCGVRVGHVRPTLCTHVNSAVSKFADTSSLEAGADYQQYPTVRMVDVGHLSWRPPTWLCFTFRTAESFRNTMHRDLRNGHA